MTTQPYLVTTRYLVDYDNADFLSVVFFTAAADDTSKDDDNDDRKLPTSKKSRLWTLVVG